MQRRPFDNNSTDGVPVENKDVESLLKRDREVRKRLRGRHLIEIEGFKGKLARDMRNMALLNIDKQCISKDSAYKLKKKQEEEQSIVINTMQSEISSLKSDISSILDILRSMNNQDSPKKARRKKKQELNEDN